MLPSLQNQWLIREETNVWLRINICGVIRYPFQLLSLMDVVIQKTMFLVVGMVATVVKILALMVSTIVVCLFVLVGG